MIGVAADERTAGPALRSLASRYGIDLISRGLGEVPWLLCESPEGIELRDNRRGRAKPIRIDLTLQPAVPRRNDPLRRAIGRGVRVVVDATAGLGADARLLRAMGHDVVAVERVPVVALLLDDAVSRSKSVPGTAPLRFIFGDSCEVLSRISPAPDVVYLDPMYPQVRKSHVLARRTCRALRELVGHNEDAGQLWAAAVAVARRRVVVKRPLGAMPLVSTPAFSHKGKQVRFDVYPANRSSRAMTGKETASDPASPAR